MNDLRSLLLTELSRRNTDLVADVVRARPELFDTLFGLYLDGGDPVDRRAAWVVDLLSEERPELLEGKIPLIVDRLASFGHDGLRRHSLRMLARSPLPDEDRTGLLITLCFEWLLSAASPAAVKVHAMDILYRIAQEEPVLRRELADSIEWRLEEESPGVRNKAGKLLKKLYAEMDAQNDRP